MLPASAVPDGAAPVRRRGGSRTRGCRRQPGHRPLRRPVVRLCPMVRLLQMPARGRIRTRRRPLDPINRPGEVISPMDAVLLSYFFFFTLLLLTPLLSNGDCWPRRSGPLRGQYQRCRRPFSESASDGRPRRQSNSTFKHAAGLSSLPDLFHLPLSEGAYAEFQQFSALTDAHSLEEDDDDIWSFRWGNMFSVKKAYDLLAPGVAPHAAETQSLLCFIINKHSTRAVILLQKKNDALLGSLICRDPMQILLAASNMIVWETKEIDNHSL